MNAERQREFEVRWAKQFWLFFFGDVVKTAAEREEIELWADEIAKLLDEYDWIKARGADVHKTDDVHKSVNIGDKEATHAKEK